MFSGSGLDITSNVSTNSDTAPKYQVLREALIQEVYSQCRYPWPVV
jgi:hypothetical protein